MFNRNEKERRRRETGLGAIAVAAFAVVCCAGLPFVIAGLGSIAVGAWLGIGAGALALVGLVFLVVSGRLARSRKDGGE
jgi:hypothetical protein